MPRPPRTPRWPGPLRRRWVRVIAALVAGALVAGSLTTGWLVARYRSIERERFGEGTLADSAAGAPQNFLVVGTDSRRFVGSEADAASFGTAEEVGPPRADTILVVRTFPAEDEVAIVSFPRDLLVKVAGSGSEDRINTAIEAGSDQLVRTIGENFGIRVNHFVEVDFRGFKTLVDAIGGVTVHFPAPARDWDQVKQSNPTGLEVERSGCVDLDGGQALAYVRSRHYQQLVDGRWQPDPAGDLNRVTRQQEFLRTTLEQSARRGLRNPVRLKSLIDVAVHNVTLDDRLGVRDLRALSRRFRTLQAGRLRTYPLPTAPGKTASGADVLILDVAAAEAVLDVFRGRTTRPAEPTPARSRVRIVHGTEGGAAAGAAAFRLVAAGFEVDPTATAEPLADQTVVRHRPGAAASAGLLAARLVQPPHVEEAEVPEGADLVLVIGGDWRGVRDANSPASTTAPATPTPNEPPPPARQTCT